MHTYSHVYADFSYGANKKSYFVKLVKDIHSFVNNPAHKNLKPDIKRICDHILFGTDFMMNLIEIESYKKYLETNLKTEAFDKICEKEIFFTTNPHKFLFGTES